MKRILLVWMLVCAAWSLQAADLNPITQAFKAGNASSLAQAMDKEVDMALPDATQTCQAADAVNLLGKFFQGHKPSGFTVVHHADKSEKGFFVAKLKTTQGDFRVNVAYRVEGERILIQSIRIE
ncbi:MAG: DUF4783 domain-containing protein [Parabacteroides sp.]